MRLDALIWRRYTRQWCGVAAQLFSVLTSQLYVYGKVFICVDSTAVREISIQIS